MTLYLTIKTIHIISATILFGTGIGIAFFMWRSASTNNLQEKYFAARTTVLADYVFTTPAVILQPITGAWLVWYHGWPWNSHWLLITYVLYIVAGICWLPVVSIQRKLKILIALSLENNKPLPEEYDRLFKRWFYLGWPAFASLLGIFYLMVTKPV